jgi:hypothetical protein
MAPFAKTGSMSAAWSLLLLLSATKTSPLNAFTAAPKEQCRQLSNQALTLQASSESYQGEEKKTLLTPREARIRAPFAAMAASVTAAAGLSSPSSPLVLPANAVVASPDFDTSVRTFFPGAVPNSVINLRVTKKLKDRDYRPYNTILGSSLCSDEIDSTALSLVQNLQRSLTLKNDGGVFNLGGLGGVPFVGKSGFGAFLSHVPVNGKVVILYGPHVGISNEGVVGKVERVGQSNPSTSCGAAVGAYKAIKAGGRGPNDKFDYQEEFIIDELTPKLQTLLEQQKNSGAVNGFVNQNTAIAAVTCNMFDIVNDVLESQLEASFAKPGFWDKISEVTLLGGIVVNRGHGAGLVGGDDYFQPLQFKAINKNGEVDMWDQVFGDLKRTA